MGASSSRSPASDGGRLKRIPTALRLTSRTDGGVTDRRATAHGDRGGLPPGGSETDPGDWPFIESCLARLLLFSGPAGPAAAAAASRSTWTLAVAAGDIVAREGEERGPAAAEAYVVRAGEFELLQARGGDTVRVDIARRGDCVGEIALVYPCPRQATLAAVTPGELWVLSRDALRGAARAAARARGPGGRAPEPVPTDAALFLTSAVPLLARLEPDARAALAAGVIPRVHAAGDVLAAAGDALPDAATLCIVRSGELEATPPRRPGRARGAARTLLPGDWFGAVDAACRAHADTVVAITDAVTLAVDGAAFRAVVAPLLAAARPPRPPPAADPADFIIKRRAADGSWTATTARGRGADARALGATAARPAVTLVDGPPLGAGAFSRVTLATDTRTGRRFALKRMAAADVAACPEHVYCEAAVARGAVHPFCVRTYATFRDATHLYLLSDALPGGDLMDVLAADARVVRATRLPPWLPACGRPPPRVLRGLDERVARWHAGCVVLALSHLHSRGVVYRDLKPENVFVDAHGYGRLGDFGFAKALDPGTGRTHTFCGTPGYVAPENVLAAGYGASVDWWGLGVTLYVLLTGRQPFSAPRSDDPMVVMRRIVDAEWRVPFPPYLSRSAKDILSRLLTRDPAARLGCGPGGAGEVMAHPWFAGLDWDRLAARRLAPPRPAGDDAAKRIKELTKREERRRDKGRERGSRSSTGAAEPGERAEADIDAIFADF